MGKTMSPIFSAVLDRILFMLAGNDNIHESLDEFEFGQILSGTTELAALEHLKKSMLPLFLVSQLWLYLGNSQVSVYRTIGPLVIMGLRMFWTKIWSNIPDLSVL